MEITGGSLDEILIKLYEALVQDGRPNVSSRGKTLELLGVSIRLYLPRARLSRSEDRGKLFSALGELLWYLSGSDDLGFIRPYIPQYEKEAEGDRIHGGYGSRLFKMHGNVNQIESVSNLLKDRPTTRRAVIQLFDANDIASHHKDVPCTTALQFLLRDGRLHVSAMLRSNDAYWGLPHDAFCFTMIQEMMARHLGVDLGQYYHYVGSMHVYVDKLDELERYMTEGHQRPFEMPSLPGDRPFELARKLLHAEQVIREGGSVVAAEVFDDPYWADLTRLVQVFWAGGDHSRIRQLKEEIVDRVYLPYIMSRRSLRPHAAPRGPVG